MVNGYAISPQAYYYTWSLRCHCRICRRCRQDVSLTTGGSPAAGGAGSNTIITPNTNKKLRHDAWQVAVSYFLTGEDASFRGVKPKQDFDFGTGWGAWELVARYSEINLDEDTFKDPTGTSFTGAYADLSTSAKSARSWTGGVNWYLNQNARVALNYSHTTFDWWRRCWYDTDQRSRNKCARSSERTAPYSLVYSSHFDQTTFTNRTWRNGS